MQTDDHFVAKLKELKIELKQCQTSHHLESCYPCEKTLGCELRQEYIKKVYDSMSKGETGGFEF